MEVLLRWWAVSCVALALCSCTSTRVLAPTEAKSLSTRSWNGPTDEVYDATWLTLTAHGFEVLADDRLAGTLRARRDGVEWEVDVAALGNSQRVTLTPMAPVPNAQLSQVLDVLDEGTAKLLSAWAALPEWKFDGRRNLLVVPGLALAPPPEWEWLDFDLSRRVVTVQKSRVRTGLNPTLLVVVDRMRPRSRLLETAQRALGASLSAHQRLSFPDELKQGTVRVLDGTTPQVVTWSAKEWDLGAISVRVVAACAGEVCIALPTAIVTEAP